MIDFSKYGYKNASAFLRATNVSKETFEAVASDGQWKIAKRALLHQECPLDLRERFRQHPVWWKRFVAIFASKAPKGYKLHALKDPDRRVRKAYLRPLREQTTAFLQKLEVL